MDTFRTTYRELSDEEKSRMGAVKDKAEELLQLMNAEPDGRYKSMAVTALEQSVMWMVKQITG